MTIGYGSISEFPISSYDEITSYIIFDDTNLYSVPASERVIFSPSYNIGLEPLYYYNLGYPLGSILLGLDAIKRETIFYDLESNDLLNLNQTVHLSHNIDAPLLNQELEFVEELIIGRVAYLEFEQELEFVQEAKRIILAPHVEQLLDFNENLIINLTKIIEVQQLLELFDNSDVNISYFRESFDQLNLIDNTFTNKTVNLFFNQNLEFADLAKNIRIIDIQQELEFTEDVSVIRHLEFNSFQGLLLNQSVTINVSRHLLFEQTLNFTNAKKYIPIAGKLVNIPIVDIYVSNKQTNYLILESFDKMLVLPTSEWGDTDKPENEVEVRRSMNNTVYSFIKRNELRTFRYEFEVGRLKALEYLDFINDSLGERIYVRDWKNNLYYGNIIKNPVDANMVSRFENEIEKAIISFDFVGVKI